MEIGSDLRNACSVKAECPWKMSLTYTLPIHSQGGGQQAQRA